MLLIQTTERHLFPEESRVALEMYLILPRHQQIVTNEICLVRTSAVHHLHHFLYITDRVEDCHCKTKFTGTVELNSRASNIVCQSYSILDSLLISREASNVRTVINDIVPRDIKMVNWRDNQSEINFQYIFFRSTNCFQKWLLGCEVLSRLIIFSDSESYFTDGVSENSSSAKRPNLLHSCSHFKRSCLICQPVTSFQINDKSNSSAAITRRDKRSRASFRNTSVEQNTQIWCKYNLDQL